MRVALRVSFALVAIVSMSTPALARAAPGGREVLVFTMSEAGLSDLLGTPAFLSLAQRGGAGLLSMANPGDPTYELRQAQSGDLAPLPVTSHDLGSMAGRLGATSPVRLQRAAAQVARGIGGSTATDALVFVISGSPRAADAAVGDQLGAVIVAQGPPSELVAAMGSAAPSSNPPRTLSSDSTRRSGIVTSRDLATTAVAFAGMGDVVRDPGGSQIRVVDRVPPVDLHARYLQYRRLTVPVGTAAGIYVTLGGLLALLALGWRRSPRWLRTVTAWIAISSPLLALALLLVGHLASLTAASVITFLVAVTALGTLALVPVARRRGSLTAIAAAGAALLIAFAIEAAAGWTAALTPMLGGSQLDGGRFFGLPNAFIGLLLGGSVYVAQRLPRAWGTGLIAAVGLFAGSPWTGSNIGAAITLFAGAGIWWGLRGQEPWARTLAAAAVSVIVGTGLVVVAHRFLTSAPTHITRFAESTGGLAGLWHKLVDRLGVGVDLIHQNPFALVPVVGVIATLVLVLRPIPPVRITFVEAPAWRAALLTIVIASLVAYAVNDSGAAAIGEGFTTSFAALLYVSLLRRNGIMEEA